jgi:pyrimidine-nucleoside phosphorylase
LRPYELIAKKRDGGEHTPEEINFIIRSVTDGTMPDYQIAAWLMAIYLRGMTHAEILAMTLAMRDSGEQVHWGNIQGVKLDKHSSGGVGDKTTLVVMPLLAAAGVPMLKMSGRGLGFSGGTIDKMESIPGFRTDLTIEEAREQVLKMGAALLGQSPHLVPADKKLYALRDVTATVESIPLLATSIMSKKLAGGADAVLLDVKVGSGAFMKSQEGAHELAATMVEIGRGAGVKTIAAITAMDEPLGYSIGNALEVAEACATLTGQGRVDEKFRDLCLTLGGWGLVLTGKAKDEAEGKAVLEELLQNGKAASKFAELITAQGGDGDIVAHPEKLPAAKTIIQVPAQQDGFVESINAQALGHLAMEMGAGRATKEDTIDPAAGIILMKKTGDAVKAGEVLAELHLNEKKEDPAFSQAIYAAYTFSSTPPPTHPLIYEMVS